MIKAYSMEGRTGNEVPNQVIVENGSAKYFCSYGRTVARVTDKSITLDRRYYKYSTTTGKYLGQFLRQFTPYKNADEALKKGGAKLGDLN